MKRKGNIFLILLAAVALIALSAAGYFYFQNQKLKQELVKITPTPTPQIDETANWKSYKHNDYNYTIRFPQSLMINEKPYPLIDISSINQSGRTEPGLNITIMLWDPNTNCKTDLECFSIIESTYTGAMTAGSTATYRPLAATISGRGAKGIEAWFSGVSRGGTVIPSSLIYEYALSLKGRLLDIKFTASNYSSKEQALPQKQLFDQILSTFKFLDSQPTPTCRPRPACLDATPHCLIPVTPDMCPAK